MRSAVAVVVLIGAVTLGVAVQAQQGPPRIPAVAEGDWTQAQRDIVATFSRGGAPGNDIKTLLIHPALALGALPFHVYVTAGSTIPARDRELLILRTAWLSRSEYVWTAHLPAANAAGITDAEIARLGAGPLARQWSAFDAALLQAADDLTPVPSSPIRRGRR